MKISIATTITILILATWLGWREETRIAAARDNNTSLVAKAASSGIRLDPERPARVTKRLRDVRNVDVQALVNKMLDFYSKAKESRSQEEREALEEIFDSLDAAGFRELFAKLEESTPADLKSREEALQVAINQFSCLFPQATLEFLAESPDVFETGNPGKLNAILIAISTWASEVPDAALAWYRGNKDKSPDFSSEQMPGIILRGIARKDLKLAFRVMDEFGVTDVGLVVKWDVPDNRKADLEALREYAAGLADPVARNQTMERGLKSLSEVIFTQDFATSEKWLENAKLSPSERTILAESFQGGYPSQSVDSGKWIGWINGSLSAEKAEPKIAWIVKNWTLLDYHAAADWIATTPDGPAKSTAILTYADVVSEYQPETARQWAENLPPGDDREAALKIIADQALH